MEFELWPYLQRGGGRGTTSNSLRNLKPTLYSPSHENFKTIDMCSLFSHKFIEADRDCVNLVYNEEWPDG